MHTELPKTYLDYPNDNLVRVQRKSKPVIILSLCVAILCLYAWQWSDPSFYAVAEKNCTKYRLEVRLPECPENYTRWAFYCIKRCDEGYYRTIQSWTGEGFCRKCDAADYRPRNINSLLNEGTCAKSDGGYYEYEFFPISCADDEDYYNGFCYKNKCGKNRLGECTCKIGGSFAWIINKIFG